MTSDDARGAPHQVELGPSHLAYRDTGEGPPVVFVHGLLAGGGLWREVVPAVAAAGYRCLTPDWPLGAHTVPVPDADLTPPGVARLLADFLEALDLRDATIVANDTGGAITQIAMVEHPARIGRVVLTPSDCFERFFPPPFDKLPTMAKVPGFVWGFSQGARFKRLARSPLGFGLMTVRPIPDDLLDEWMEPSRTDRRVRADLRRFVTSVHRRHTLAAAERFGEVTAPVLLLWARGDKLFPGLVERLAEALPDARIEWVEDSATFIPLDQPEELARHVVDFLGATTPSPST